MTSTYEPSGAVDSGRLLSVAETIHPDHRRDRGSTNVKLMRYVVFALDKPDSLDLRKNTREAHLAYLSQFEVLAGGPLLDDDGDMCGSMVVYEAPSKADVETIAAGDPYAQAGLFDSVVIREINTVMWPS